MFLRVSFALLFASIAAGGAAQTRQPVDANCSDDRGANRCSVEQQRQMRALYGVPTIEEHAAAGEEVRRVFYVDGYGRDLILIAFVRSPGKDPEVRVHYPQRQGGARPDPQRAAVPQRDWDTIRERSIHFDRSFTPRQGTEPWICLHSWVYTIETAVRTSNPRQPVQIRRKTEDACGDGPGGVFARDVERIALPLFPHCAALDPEQHRNEAAILDACRMLSGDRLAAAEVLNLVSAFQRLGRIEDSPRIAHLFAHETVIDWAGERYSGPGHEAAPFWTTRLARPSGWTGFYYEMVEGLSGDRVRLTGMLSRPTRTLAASASTLETASVEQIWARDHNGEMKVERATIGRWEPYRPR